MPWTLLHAAPCQEPSSYSLEAPFPDPPNYNPASPSLPLKLQRKPFGYTASCMTLSKTLSWYNLPSFLSHLCLSPAPSPSPSDSIQPHLPAFHCLHSNSEVYSCNYAMSALGLASD